MSLTNISTQFFPAYILLNQQVTVSQRYVHNRLNNESFTHIQKKLKYLLRRRPSPGKGRKGKRLNIHSDNIYTRSRKILLQLFQETVKEILAHAGEYIKRQAVSYYLSKSCSGHRRAICNYLIDISCRHTVKEQFWKFRSCAIDVLCFGCCEMWHLLFLRQTVCILVVSYVLGHEGPFDTFGCFLFLVIGKEQAVHFRPQADKFQSWQGIAFILKLSNNFGVLLVVNGMFRWIVRGIKEV